MRVRLGVVITAILTAATLAACGSDADSSESTPTEATVMPTATFKPKAALLTPGDLPGYEEVGSSPGAGICGFRLVERAANGGRATFQNVQEGALVEHLVLLFGGDAETSLDAFTEAVEGCASGSAGDYTLKYTLVPVKGISADQVVGVEAVSTAGTPPINSLTIVARDGDEVVSVAVVATDRKPNALAKNTVKIALKRLRKVRGTAT